LVSKKRHVDIDWEVSSSKRKRDKPSWPEFINLTAFFGPAADDWYGVQDWHGVNDWHGVLIKPLASNTSRQDVKKLCMFSGGLEDTRVLKAQNAVEAYAKFKGSEFAEEAERILNGREFNGNILTVTVIHRPSSVEIFEMAANCSFNEELAAMSNSQPSGSEEIPTPSTNISQKAVEYTTMGKMPSPVGGHLMTRSDTESGNDMLPDSYDTYIQKEHAPVIQQSENSRGKRPIPPDWDAQDSKKPRIHEDEDEVRKLSRVSKQH
jgi:hypothetical protein